MTLLSRLLWEIERLKRDPESHAEASEEIFALMGEGSDFHLPVNRPALQGGRPLGGSEEAQTT